MNETIKRKYLFDNIQLVSEWDFEKNSELKLDPKKLTLGSTKKAWWKCTKGHEWESSIANRAGKKHNCPYCSGRYAITGKTDLQTINPSLANEWNYEKNIGLTPANVLPNSNKKVWWKCDKEHEWEAQISHRNKGVKCPYCAGLYAIQGTNDLQTINPFLANEWNIDKNNDLKPSDVLPYSNKKVWWKCIKGHEWQATVTNRTKGTGCPICTSERHTSFPEFAILYYLQKHGIDATHQYKKNGYELDIYIPSLKIAIEYDGYYWHKNKVKQDLKKNTNCMKDGITLYRIREGLPALNDSSIDYIVKRNQEDLGVIIGDVLCKILGKIIKVDLSQDLISIENLREHTEKENSISHSNLQIALEWNYEKNGQLHPENFTQNSNKKVWWKCNQGHEWQAKISNRNCGYGCPYCAGLTVLKGYNDLQTINPTLAQDWNYEKNSKLTPSDVMSNSGKKVWWRCADDHEWQATIASRNEGKGCPYCSNRKIIEGYNDLESLDPTLASEWCYEKNGAKKPKDFTKGSKQKVWWKCVNGHEWQATIYNRTYGYGCPYCSGKTVVKGTNDLQSVNPIIADEWNYMRNDKSPTDFKSGSHKRVWWQCKKGHEWEATIDSRSRGNGCPYCSGRYVVKGENDLKTVNPILAGEWNYKKNLGLTPEDVKPNSNKKVWWICVKGHEWEATISNRNQGKGCPYCSGRKKQKV